MNLLEKLCKELGVEVGEIWLGSDGFKYKITQEGDLIFIEPNTDPKTKARISRFEKVDDISRLLTESLKPVWRPKEREKYYYPEIAYNTHYGVSYWKNGTVDNLRLMRGIVFKTKEEAIGCANRMLESTKQ